MGLDAFELLTDDDVREKVRIVKVHRAGQIIGEVELFGIYFSHLIQQINFVTIYGVVGISFFIDSGGEVACVPVYLVLDSDRIACVSASMALKPSLSFT